MTVNRARTDAEEQLARQFKGVAAQLPGGGWVPQLRSGAMQAFEAVGLPHRRIEEWKYTDLRTGIVEAFPPAGCSRRKVDDRWLGTLLGGDLGGLLCIRLVLLNGRYVASFVPPGHEAGTTYHAGSLAASLGQPDYDWMQACFAVAAKGAGGDPVMALNTAFATDGIVLRVVQGAQLALPIHIVSIVEAEAPKAVATRNLIAVSEGATATVIESHIEVGGSPTQTTAVTQLSVSAGGTAHHIKHVAAGAASVHLGRTDVEIAATARYQGFQLTAGAGLLRNESRVGFTGPDASLDLSGLMLGRGRDHIDTTLVVDHTTTGCESRELFKAVLADRARAVFQGKVVVAAQAQKTDGKQMAKALMLSEDAEFDSKPELEIYADDVACGHGSTAAELDADMLFYLRARGIPLPEARALLIESFAAEALEKIDDETVRAAMRAVAVDWLGTLR